MNPLVAEIAALVGCEPTIPRAILADRLLERECPLLAVLLVSEADDWAAEYPLGEGDLAYLKWMKSMSTAAARRNYIRGLAKQKEVADAMRAMSASLAGAQAEGGRADERERALDRPVAERAAQPEYPGGDHASNPIA